MTDSGASNSRDNDIEIDYTHHYRRWHDDSDAHFKDMADYFANKLKPFLPRERASRIFEIGCGMGFALGGLQTLGYQNIEGIDADRGQVAAAHRRGLSVKHVPVSENGSVFSNTG
jgi:trans-aconitate methyltransferase